MQRKYTEITVIGKDKKGVIARFTMFLFENGINIEDLDQNVIKGMFSMTLHADTTSIRITKEEFIKGIERIGNDLQMDVRVRFPGEKRKPAMAILATKEPHCLNTLLDAWKNKEIDIEIPCILSNKNELKNLAYKANIPFFVFDAKDQHDNEIEMLKKLDEFEIDFITLARYMKILSPDFVWRYENRIINIHPSLLPAFPGSQAYRQALEKGVRIAGVTAHFVTMDLDQGPIIVQESFRINKEMQLSDIVAKGQELESKALLKATKLYLKNRLKVHWGKVYEL